MDKDLSRCQRSSTACLSSWTRWWNLWEYWMHSCHRSSKYTTWDRRNWWTCSSPCARRQAAARWRQPHRSRAHRAAWAWREPCRASNRSRRLCSGSLSSAYWSWTRARSRALPIAGEIQWRAELWNRLSVKLFGFNEK